MQWGTAAPPADFYKIYISGVACQRQQHGLATTNRRGSMLLTTYRCVLRKHLFQDSLAEGPEADPAVCPAETQAAILQVCQGEAAERQRDVAAASFGVTT